MSINRVTVIGRLTRDPQHSTTESGTSTTQFTIAVDDPTKDKDGNPTTSYFLVITWNALADSVSKNLRKGWLVGVDGRLRQHSWEKDGKKNTRIEIVANTVEFLAAPKTAKEIPNEDLGYQSDEEEEIKSSPAINFVDEPENLDRESKNLETIEEPTDDDLPF